MDIVCWWIYCFITEIGIGFNDAVNYFATSVGSKSLTYKQCTF